MTTKRYASYARLSEEELRSKIDPGVLADIQEEMRRLVGLYGSQKVVYVGPPAERIKDRSIPAQLQDAASWLTTHGHRCYGVVVDYDRSGADMDRKGFLVLDTWIREGKIDGVIFKDDKRFGRNVEYTERMFRLWKAAGAELHLVYGDEHFQDDFLRPLYGVINQQPIIDGKKYWKRKRKRKEEAKEPLFNPPWGYVWNSRKTQWIKDRKVKDKVVPFFTDVASKRPWNEVCRKYKISHTTLYRRVRKVRVYAGLVLYKPRKSRTNRQKEEFVEYQGSHEPYFSPAVADGIVRKWKQT